jgi:hypothetical protein
MVKITTITNSISLINLDSRLPKGLEKMDLTSHQMRLGQIINLQIIYNNQRQTLQLTLIAFE